MFPPLPAKSSFKDRPPSECRAFLLEWYFNVSKFGTICVNDFANVEEFAAAQVAELKWGLDADAQTHRKEEFARGFPKVLLAISDLALTPVQILDELAKKQRNDEAVAAWVSLLTRHPAPV